MAVVTAPWGGDPPRPRGEGGAAQALQAYGDLPLTFVENRGQVDSRVRYHAQGSRYAFHATREGLALSFFEQGPSAAGRSRAGVALGLRFVGAGPDVTVEGRDRAPGTVNYLRGDDPRRWQTDVPAFRALRYREVWPGIDMVVRGRDGTLKYEFHVRPGARPSDIRLAYAGADGLAPRPDGGLAIATPMGELRDAAPVSYQVVDGDRVTVDSRYRVLHAGADPRYGFALGEHRADRPLVIDPGIAYSTFLGGSSDEDGNAVAVDSSGNAYIAGSTQSTDLPTTTGAFDRTFNGGLHDAFVAKVNADGSGLAYLTYLGGSPTALPAGGTDDIEHGRAIAVDSSGNAYVAGQTSSSNFPTTSGAWDTQLAVGQNTATDGFVAKLDATGSGLVYSTLLGGTPRDDVRGIAVDASGNAYVTGDTASGFPTTSGAFDETAGGGVDAFATKLNSTGSALVYSGFLGGADNEIGNDVVVDSGGNAYVVGGTRSADFTTTEGAHDRTRGGTTNTATFFDGYLAKINAAGSALTYSTFLGGDDVDRVESVAIDGDGNAYAVGGTNSADFPTTAGAFDRTGGPRSDGLQGVSDTFATKVDSTGSALVYSTFLNQGGASDIVLDSGRNAWIAGTVSSERASNTDNAHTTPDGAQTQFGGGGGDAHVHELSADGSSRLYGTFLGGTSSDVGAGIALDGNGDAYVAGGTLSADFPTTAGAYDRTFAGNPSMFWGDAFVTKLDVGGGTDPAPTASLSSVALQPTTVQSGGTSTGTITLTAAAPAGGAQVALVSSDPSAASVPTSVTVPEGATTETFAVTTQTVSSDTTVTISATYDVTRSATLTVTAAATEPEPTRETVTFTGRIDRNQTLRHSVTVGADGLVDYDLNWTDTRANLTLRVVNAAGTTVHSHPGTQRPKRGSFTATAGTYSFEVTNTTRRRTDYTLSVTRPVAPEPEPEPAALSSLALDPSSVTGGESSTGTVTLTAPAPTGGAAVSLASDTTAATVPGSVTVAAGETSASFTVSTSTVDRDTSANIGATYEGVTRTAALAIAAPPPEPAALSSLSLDPTSVTGGDPSTGTVTLTAPAPTGGASVALSSSSTSATVPTSVSVPAGETSATFTVSTSGVLETTSAVISGTYDGVTRSATLSITAPVSQPAPAELSSLTLDPTSVPGGTSSTGTVTLTAAAPDGGAVVTLSSDSTAASVPVSVTVPAGQTTATFTVTTTSVTADTSATITATHGVSRTATLAVTAPAPAAALSSLALDPTSVTGGTTSTGTVTLTAAAPTGGASVGLASSNTAVATVPESVTVPAGATSATFTVNTSSVTAETTATITAAYAGETRAASLTITPAVATDTVNITRAEYEADKDRLRIEATSSGAGATLTAHVTSTDQFIGTLSGGKLEVTWPSNPGSVTVKSSLGGSATRTVTLK